MANLGSLEALVAGFTPPENKARLLALLRELVRNIRFGAPGDGVVRAENFGGALVPFVTSGTANQEIAVAHNLARVPRLLVPILRLDTVNATVPTLTVTRAADMGNFYVSSPTTHATSVAYVE